MTNGNLSVIAMWISADAASCLNTITSTNCQGSLQNIFQNFHTTMQCISDTYLERDGKILELILHTARTKK